MSAIPIISHYYDDRNYSNSILSKYTKVIRGLPTILGLHFLAVKFLY